MSLVISNDSSFLNKETFKEKAKMDFLNKFSTLSHRHTHNWLYIQPILSFEKDCDSAVFDCIPGLMTYSKNASLKWLNHMLEVIFLLVRSCTWHDHVLMCLLSLYALRDALTYLGCLQDHVSRMVFALKCSIYLQAFCDNFSLNSNLNLNPRNLSALID